MSGREGLQETVGWVTRHGEQPHFSTKKKSGERCLERVNSMPRSSKTGLKHRTHTTRRSICFPRSVNCDSQHRYLQLTTVKPCHDMDILLLFLVDLDMFLYESIMSE